MLLVASAFDFPMGNIVERRDVEIPPGRWLITNPFLNYYNLGPGETNPAYHTGIDILVEPGGGCGEPIHACANGEILFAQRIPNSSWGNVIIQHCLLPDGRDLYIRYAHSNPMLVKAGDPVLRGQMIADESNAFGRFVCHCHLDFSLTTVLRDHPADWPGLDRFRLERDYIDPQVWIKEHRPMSDSTPQQIDDLLTQALDLVKTLEVAPPPPPPPPIGVVKYVNTTGTTTLNLRSAPLVDPANVIGHLARGVALTIDPNNTSAPGWSSVLSINGNPITEAAWVNSQFLSDTRP